MLRLNLGDRETGRLHDSGDWRRFFWDVFLTDAELSGFPSLFDDLRPERFPFEFQCPLESRGGDSLWVYWTSTAVVGENGSVEFVVATGVDITALKQAESEDRSA